MLCKKTCLFMELDAFSFSVSTSNNASVSLVANMSCIEYTVASHSVSCTPYSCKFPSVFVTSSFTILMATFLAILNEAFLIY